jgi:excisionase family DNA binding protein
VGPGIHDPHTPAESRSCAEAIVLTVNEVAQQLRVSRSTIYSLVERGLMSCHRIGTGRGSIRFSDEQVEAFLQACRVEAGVPRPGFKFTHGRQK